jgi:hypothetical protein
MTMLEKRVQELADELVTSGRETGLQVAGAGRRLSMDFSTADQIGALVTA